MADAKISALPSGTISDSDEFPVNDGGTTSKVTFAAIEAALSKLTLITDATTTRTLALTDAGRYIRCTSGDATTVTVPPSTDVAFATGTVVTIRQAGAGQVTIAQGDGVTVNSPETLLARGQHATLSLIKVATDTWDLTGDLEESA